MAVITTVGNTGKCLHLEVAKPNFVVKYLTSPKVAIIVVTQKRRKMRFQEALICEMSLQNQPTTLENMTV